MYFLVNMKYEHGITEIFVNVPCYFVCKYRKVILEPISEELKQIMIDISKESNFEILEMKQTKTISIS